MGFWLATLNPGKTRRKRGKRRTKLTAWQRAVKRHGGVMQAVKALSLEAPPRILIGGSLYLAGDVLKRNGTPPV